MSAPAAASASADIALELHGLAHRYGDRQALSGVDLTVRRGEIFALLGPNGGGKTTLFRIVSTLIMPSAGTAAVCGHDVGREPDAVRRCLGVLFQSPSLDPHLTVTENLRHSGRLFGLRGAELEARIATMLERVRLADRAKEIVARLSGGLRRRADLAKAMLHGPEVLLLDEPSTGLDPGARRDLRDYLRHLREREGTTVILTTHLMDEAQEADRLAILDRGAVVALGTPAELKGAVGGDVIEVCGPDPEQLADEIRTRFGGSPRVIDGAVLIERPRAHEFLVEMLPALSGRIDSVAVRHPTLEDLFIARTGHRFWAADEAAGEAP